MPYRKVLEEELHFQSDSPIRVERFRADLQVRVLGRAGLGEGENLRAILLTKGSATLKNEKNEDISLVAPFLTWLPWRIGMQLKIDAGAQGIHLFLNFLTLQRILKRWPEALQLALFTNNDIMVPLENDISRKATIETSFDAILSETMRPTHLSSAAIESYLHIVLIHLHRSQDNLAPAVEISGSSNAIASEFARLVERHFLEGRTVEVYARKMNISRDRLNDICLRIYQRNPGLLLRERLALEATRYLEASSLSLEQISGTLGFSGASQFNRFYKTMKGQTPGQFRKTRRTPEAQILASSSHEWP